MSSDEYRHSDAAVQVRWLRTGCCCVGYVQASAGVLQAAKTAVRMCQVGCLMPVILDGMPNRELVCLHALLGAGTSWRTATLRSSSPRSPTAGWPRAPSSKSTGEIMDLAGGGQAACVQPVSCSAPAVPPPEAHMGVGSVDGMQAVSTCLSLLQCAFPEKRRWGPG